jgi:serine/threonine protein kinase
VYLAEETRLGRKVALKVLPPELTFGHGVDRFLREAKTAATLDHPNIIPIYRIASGGKLFWYAMKYLEGRSLEDVLREQGTYSLDETIGLLEQVADALDYAHDHQVIHRDIKPANVMLDSRNRVIITDFGIAKALSEGALTASGSVIGTPYFMSPEQGMGKPVAGAADQYSVAVMAFRMLAGHIPFDGDSAIDILHKHCMMDPPRLEDSMPNLPRHVCDAIDKALSKKADDRFPNIRTFVKALKDPSMKFTRPSARTEVIDTNELEKKNSGPLPKVKPRPGAADKTIVAGAQKAVAEQPKSKSALWGAVAAVIVIGGGFGVYTSVNSQSEPPESRVEQSETATKTPPTAGTANPPADPPASNPVVNTPTPAPVVTEPTPTKSAPVQQAPRQTAQTPPRTPATQPNNTPTTTTPPVTAPTNPAPAPAAGGPATLRLAVSPGGNVFIDGVAKGETTRVTETLSPGDHLIRVEKAGFARKDTVVTLRAGETATVRLTLTPTP